MTGTPNLTSPVFIDQMPDYQQAMQKIAELLPHKTAMEARARELGLDAEFQKMKAGLDALQPQMQGFLAEEEQLRTQARTIDPKLGTKTKIAAIAGNILTWGGGIFSGVMWGRCLGVMKGILIGVATTVGIGILSILGTKLTLGPATAKAKSLEIRAFEHQAQIQQLATQETALLEPFMNTMATKLLSEQKMLEGEGERMKLVSTAQQAPAPSLPEISGTPPAPGAAQRYNIQAPAASKTDAAVKSRAEASSGGVMSPS